MLSKKSSVIRRYFGSANKECLQSLKMLGFRESLEVVHNPSVGELYEYALRPEHQDSCDPSVHDSTITETGALSCSSGERTGRSPKDKRIVFDETTKEIVNWGKVNIPLEPHSFLVNKSRAVDFLNTRKRIFVVDSFAGWDEAYRMKIRIISSRPYHALFMKQMLIRAPIAHIQDQFSKNGPDFTIINSGEFVADPQTAGMTSKVSVDINFSSKELVILGTSYAGEMKKGVFSLMHYYMPLKKVLSMHCSANQGRSGDTTIMFGLSGTGKTTLSSDPERQLIGDDEHCWTEHNIFNIEGGCYAKCDNLSSEKEPQIFDAVKFGSVLENICYYKNNTDDARTVNYTDTSLTQNTRVCYPLENITNVKVPAVASHPKNVIFLTCDASGVLPPVSQLTPEQAKYHFISGYTSKVAGTEMGVKDPIPTFSACFGEAFLVHHPYVYAELLEKQCALHGSKVWLINTGWVKGPYGVGQRMNLGQTRAILDAIHNKTIDMSKYQIMKRFGLKVPQKVTGVPSEILRPIEGWADKEAYKETSLDLAIKFHENFQHYIAGVPSSVVRQGGPNLEF